MKAKRMIDVRRRRTVPSSFGWVDHRLVREGLIRKCDKGALALYLFLIVAADADGLSYYSDAKTARLLNMTEQELQKGRNELLKAGWVLWDGWLYQVVRLESSVADSFSKVRTVDGPRVLKDILVEMIGEVNRD